MKIVLELIERFISISGNSVVDLIIFLFIGIISFSVAFGLVGLLFDAVGKYNSKAMSNVHWGIRIVVFIGLTFIFVKIAQFISWLFSFKWWVYLITIGSLISLIGLFLLIKYPLKKKIDINKTKKLLKSYLSFFCKILFDVIIIAFILTAFILNYKYFDKVNIIATNILFLREDAIHIIISIFPFVLTVLSIALSMPKELIYGLEKTEFRKLKKANRYNFLLMLFIALFIFVLYFIGSSLNYQLVILVLAIISIIYSFYFLWQEIPLLMHSDKRIQKIIKKNIWLNVYNENLNTVLHNLLFKKGISYTYGLLMKENKEEENLKIINRLLDLQNYYFWRLRENLSEHVVLNPTNYKNLEIIDVIDKSFENLNILVSASEDLNIIQIYGNKEYVHHITRLFFSLNDVLIKYGMSKKSDDKFRSLLYQIFSIISLSSNEFSDKVALNYKIINTMLVHTMSTDNLWFVNLLGEHVFVSSNILGGKIEYMIFLNIYFLYLIGLEDDCPIEFKEEIKKFMDKDFGHKGLYGNNWNKVLDTRLMQIRHKDREDLLLKLLFIYNKSNIPMFWYNRSDQSVSTSTATKSFSDRLIINWWIGYTLSNKYNWSYRNDKTSCIPNLDDEYKYILARELHDNWFYDGELKEKDELFYLKLFNMDITYYEYTKTSPLVKELSSFSKNQLFNKITENYEGRTKTISDFEKYKEIFNKGFNEAIDNFSLLDKTINLEKEEEFYYNLSLESYKTETLIDMYINEIPKMLDRTLYKDFVANKQINVHILENYTENDIKEITDFNPDYKSGYIFAKNASQELQSKINKINEIPTLKNVGLPHNVFVKKDAIKVNIEFIENKSNIRYLTDQEVDIIIDRDFRLVNGLYKYLEYSNSKSGIMLTRDEIFNLISSKYIFVSLAFKFKVKYDYKKIRYFKREKKQ